MCRSGRARFDIPTGRRWVAGGALTVADISIGASMVYAAPAEYPVAGCKEIGRWYGALSELPAWKKALPS